MEIRQLHCFVAVAEELHFRRAAERIGLAQTALSAQVRNLEEELGFPLFFRTTRHVSLTQAGSVFLDEVRAVLDRLDKGVEAARCAATSELERLRIGGIDAALVWFLPPILKRMHKQFPSLHLPLTEVNASTEQVRELLRHRVDVAFFRPPVAIEGVTWEVLFEEKVLVALPENHPLAKESDINVGQIAAEPLIGYPAHARPLLHAMVKESFAEADTRPNISLEVIEKSTLLKLVSQELGIGLVPQWVSLGTHENIVFRPFSGARSKLDFGVAWRENDTSPTLKTFLQMAREEAKRVSRKLGEAA